MPSFSPCAVCPIDLVIVYDRSGSICSEDMVATCDDWERVKTFMAKLVERLDPGKSVDDNRFAVVSYGSKATVEFSLNR